MGNILNNDSDHDFNNAEYEDGYKKTRSGRQNLVDDFIDDVLKGFSLTKLAEKKDEIYEKGKEQGRKDREQYGTKE